MKTKRTIIRVLLTVILVTALVPSFVSAAPVFYQETEIHLADPSHEQNSLLRVFIRPDGTIDYFNNIWSGERRSLALPKFSHWSSGQDGKWKEISCNWLDQLRKRYPQGGEVKDVYLTQDGELYCIMRTGSTQIEKGNVVQGATVYKVFKVTNGLAKEIPNLTLTTFLEDFQIADVEPNGDIDIIADIMEFEDTTLNSSFRVYDPQTGKLKKSVPLPKRNLGYSYSKSGYLYSVDTTDIQYKLLEHNALTGELTRSMFVPGSRYDTNGIGISLCGAKDGNAYVLVGEGLYQLEPGKNTLTKLLDGKQCRLGKRAAIDASFCADDHAILVSILYFNAENENDPNNEKKGTLYLYTPK